MVEKYKTAFVILHYMNIEDTEECIASILKNMINKDYALIIVDNGSENHTGSLLMDRYIHYHNIYVLLAESNLGFAKGNNLGYTYAKNTLKVKFIVAINNDIVIQQQNFLESIYRIYEKEQFSVLGPDIIDLSGNHQNPHRIRLLSLKDVKKKIRNRTIILWYLKLKKWFHIENKIMILERLEYKHSMRERVNIKNQLKQEKVILHGSCIIFSPLYIETTFFAFYPETFLYCEEEILSYLCSKNGHKVFYSPDITVLHKTQSSVKNLMEYYERYVFNSTHLLQSEKILLKLMKTKG